MPIVSPMLHHSKLLNSYAQSQRTLHTCPNARLGPQVCPRGLADSVPCSPPVLSRPRPSLAAPLGGGDRASSSPSLSEPEADKSQHRPKKKCQEHEQKQEEEEEPEAIDESRKEGHVEKRRKKKKKTGVTLSKCLSFEPFLQDHRCFKLAPLYTLEQDKSKPSRENASPVVVTANGNDSGRQQTRPTQQ